MNFRHASSKYSVSYPNYWHPIHPKMWPNLLQIFPEKSCTGILFLRNDLIWYTVQHYLIMPRIQKTPIWYLRPFLKRLFWFMLLWKLFFFFLFFLQNTTTTQIHSCSDRIAKMCLESLSLFTFHQLIVYNLSNSDFSNATWLYQHGIRNAHFDLGHPVQQINHEFEMHASLL